jgi:hypothetical protein
MVEVRVGKVGRIAGERARGEADVRVCGDGKAVREGYGLFCYALDVHCLMEGVVRMVRSGIIGLCERKAYLHW